MTDATRKRTALGFVVCVDNEDYPVSLTVGKTYRELPEEKAGPSMIRVVDNTGEDYLFPRSMFSAENEVRVTQPENPDLYGDVSREIRGFIQENEGLLEEASALVLGRVFTQGVGMFTTISDEVIEATNRATAAKNAFSAAIRNPTTPPRRLQELEAEDARASSISATRTAALQELDAFLRRVENLRAERDEGR